MAARGGLAPEGCHGLLWCWQAVLQPAATKLSSIHLKHRLKKCDAQCHGTRVAQAAAAAASLRKHWQAIGNQPSLRTAVWNQHEPRGDSERSCLADARRELHTAQAQLLSSRQEAAEVLLPVQVHPQLLQSSRHALRGVQRFAAGHVRGPLQHLSLYGSQPGLLLQMQTLVQVYSPFAVSERCQEHHLTPPHKKKCPQSPC